MILLSGEDKGKEGKDKRQNIIEITLPVEEC